MKDIFKKIILSLSLVIGGAVAVIPVVAPEPVYAACTPDQLEKGCVNTAILGKDGCSCKEGETAENGEGVMRILNLVIRILTIGVGIFGTIGIVIVGIQYLTAGPNEEQTRKAKRRMYEIVIGMAVYVLAYAILSWLLPDFKPFGG